jgi:hypothetical protein
VSKLSEEGIMKKNGNEVAAGRRFWAAHIKAWEKSGLSQGEYCCRCNLKLSTFTWWRWKERQKTTTASIALVPVPASHPKEIENIGPGGTGLRLVVGHRCRIEIDEGFHADTFSRLISVLEGM